MLVVNLVPSPLAYHLSHALVGGAVAEQAEAEAAESRRRLAEDQRRGLKAQEVDTAVAEWRKSTGNGAGTSLKGVPQAAGKTAVSGVAEQRRTWDLSSSEDEGDEDVEVERPMRGETVPLGVEVEGNSSGFGNSSSSEHLDSDSDKEEEEEEDEEDPMGDALLDLENADIDAYAKKYGIILVEGDEEEGDAQVSVYICFLQPWFCMFPWPMVHEEEKMVLILTTGSSRSEICPLTMILTWRSGKDR